MDSNQPSVFGLTVPSRMEELETVQQFAESCCEALGIDKEVAYWIELTVSESAINAIQHGNALDPSKEVFLQISSDGDTVEIVVEDQGTGFKLSEIPDPTDVENLLKPGGRGIMIIQSFMDSVEVSDVEGGGSRLRMLKSIAGASHS
jgi:serine/threonine-protein kinase RsbW